VNLLLDTQALLWWREGNRKLGPRTRQAIEGGAASVVVSVVTGWEIAIKSCSGRLRLPQAIDLWMPAVLKGGRFDVLDIRMAHAVAVAALPSHHADPFDRLLIVQAQIEGLTIVTSDRSFDDYDVKVLDARV
jgi:PIN domain nuclease of toxin-antitoxin system